MTFVNNCKLMDITNLQYFIFIHFCFINLLAATSNYIYKTSKKICKWQRLLFTQYIYIHLVKSRNYIVTVLYIYIQGHMYIQKEQCHQPYMNHSQPINFFQTPFSILFLGKDKPSPSSSKTLYTSHSRSPITCLPTSACWNNINM